MKRIALVTIAVVAIAVIGAVAAFTAVFVGSNGSGLADYPDLRALPAAYIRVTKSPDTGVRWLRFQSELWNAGDGPLEMRPDTPPGGAQTYAYQRLYTHDANGNLVFAREHFAGVFAYHERHKHWHLGDFAGYQLRSAAGDGSVGDSVVASSNKVSFCLVDDDSIDPDLEHAAEKKAYNKCGQGSTQGISVGWGDVYEGFLPGQALDISAVEDGDYWLLVTADPTNILLETDDGNNTSAVKLRISGMNVAVLEGGATPSPSP